MNSIHRMKYIHISWAIPFCFDLKVCVKEDSSLVVMPVRLVTFVCMCERKILAMRVERFYYSVFIWKGKIKITGSCSLPILLS